MTTKFDRLRRSLGLMSIGCLAIAALSTALFAAPPRGANMKVSATVEAPAVIAVRVRHDLCPLCKGLDPKFPELIRQTNGESVLFVTLDLTSETTQKQAALLVGALGLEQVWTGDLSKMGSLTCLDGKSRQVLSFVQTADTKKIQDAIRKAVAAARGDG